MAREKIVVDIDADVKSLLRNLEVAKRKITDWKKSLNDANIKFDVNKPLKNLQNSLEKESVVATKGLNKQLSTVAKDIKIGVDTKQAKKDIAELEVALNRLKALSLAIKNSPFHVSTQKTAGNLAYGNNRASDARLLLSKLKDNGLDVDSAKKAVKNYENAVAQALKDSPSIANYQIKSGIISNALKDSFTMQKEAGLTPNIDKLKQKLAQVKVLEAGMYDGLADNKNAQRSLTQAIGLLQELGEKAKTVHIDGFGNGLDSANAKMQQLKAKGQNVIDKINEPEMSKAEQIRTSNNIARANNALDKEERRNRAEANKQVDAMWKQAKQEEIEQIRKDKDAEKERESTERALTSLENKERHEMLTRQKEAEKARLTQEKNTQFNTRVKNDTKGAEKAWREGDFSKYNALSADRDATIAAQNEFLNSLHSIAEQQKVYRNLLSQIKNGTITEQDPRYDTAAQLKNTIESRKNNFNNYAKQLSGDTGNATDGVNKLTNSIKNNQREVANDNKQFNELRRQLATTITEINKFDASAKTKIGSPLNDKVQEALGIMNNMKQFLTERGKLSYAAESKLYGDFLPSIKNEYARREWLKRQRAAAVNNNYANLGSGLRSNIEGRFEPTISSLNNILTTRFSGIELAKLAGSFERGFGSGMHEMARQAEMTEKSILGINSGLAVIPEAISTGVAAFAGLSVAVGTTVSVIETLFNVVQSIGSAIEDYIIKPGLEAANAMQMMRNGIAGAMSSIGLLNNQPLQFSEALNMADGIVKQLAVDAIKTGTSLEAITNTFRAIIEPGLQSGMNISQIEEMANLFTTIGKELQLNSLTIARDTRDIFNGMANRTVMAKQLGITDQEIQEVKAKGEDLYAWLENRLAGFVASNRENIATLGGAFDSLKSTWELTLASVFDNDAVKQPVIEFMKWIGSQIATVYDMGINPNSAKWDALKKSSAARNGINTSDQVAVDQNAEDTGLQDDATKYRDATGATEEETQALEEQNATVITLSNSFEGLLEFVTNFVDIIGEAVIEIAEYAEQSLGAGDSVQTLSDAISICVDLLVFIAERIIDVIALVEENRTSIEDLGYDALYAFAIIKNALLGVLSFIKPVIAGFRALYNVAKAAWDAMHGDADGAAKALTQAGVDAAEAAKGALNKYIPFAGIAITGADIITNSYRDIQTINGWRERGQQAREAGENSQPYKNLHGFTGGIRDFLNNREHILSTQNPNQNLLKGRPADNSKEQAKAQKEADKANRAAIQDSQKMLREHREYLKEILSDKIEALKDLLEKNDIAYKEGFKSIKDYYTQKTEIEKEEAAARLEEAKEELAAIQTSQFANEYDKLKEEHKVQREINKYTKELAKATQTQKEVGRDLGTYSEVMLEATTQFSNALSSMQMVQQVGTSGAQANTGDKVLDLAIEVAKQINAQTGQSPDIGILAGLIANETDNGNSPVFRDDNNIAGVTWNENYPEYMRGDARPPSEGGYYVKFPDLSAAAKDLAEVLEQDRYSGFLQSHDASDAISILHNGGYMTTSNLSGYISSAEEYQQKIAQSGITLANYISDSIGNQALGEQIGINAGNAITSALNTALNSGLRNAEMPDLANGCVEAVVRLGSWFNTFLADEYSKGVANVDRLVSDAKMQGIAVDNNTSVVQSGDVLVTNGGNHVVMVKDLQHTVGNSSHNNPNTSSGSGIMEQDLNYWLARTNAVIRTGSQGVALSGGASNGIMSLFSPHSSKEAMQAYEDMQKKIDEYKDILGDINSDIFGSQPMLEVKLRSLYEKLEKAKRNNSPESSNMVDALNIRIRQETAKVVTDALEKQLDFNIKRLETTAKYRAYEVAYGKYKNYDTDFGELARKYIGYISKPEDLSVLKDTLEKRQKIYNFLANPNGFNELKDAYDAINKSMEEFDTKNSARALTNEFNSLQETYNKYKAEMESIGWDKTNPRYDEINAKERPANDALWKFNNTGNNRSIVDAWKAMKDSQKELMTYYYRLSSKEELQSVYKKLNDNNYIKNQGIADKLNVLNDLHADTQRLLALRGNDMMSESYKAYFADWKEANDKEWAYRNNSDNKQQFDSYYFRKELQDNLREGLKSPDIGKYANIRNTQNTKSDYDKARQEFSKENQKLYEMMVKYSQGFDMSEQTAGKDITRDDLLAEKKIWSQKKSDLKIKEKAYLVAKEKSDVELSEYNKELDTLRTKINLAKQTPAYQIEKLAKEYAEYTSLGNSDKAEEVKQKLIDAQNKVYSMLNGMTQAISERYSYMNSVVENIPMTDLQREEANKEMKAYENFELNQAYKQQYKAMQAEYIDRQKEIEKLQKELSDKQAERDRLPQGSSELATATKRIDELNADIALKMELQEASMSAMQEIANKERISGMLSHIKTLLEETHVTAQKALEEGLVTFLTDGVNEAKSLGEALKNLVVDFLKTMQQFFAKRLVYGLMQQWFPAKDEFGRRPTTENLAPKVNPMDNDSYRFEFANLLEGAPKYTSIRDYDPFGLRNSNTGNYFPMNPSQPQQYTFSSNLLQNSANNASNIATQNTATQLQQATFNLTSTTTQINTSLQELSGGLEQSASRASNALSDTESSTSTANPVIDELATSATNAKIALDNLSRASSPTLGTGEIGDTRVGHKDGGLIRKFSTGGNVKGKGTSTSDSIPAMLSNGEFVVKASAVRKYGTGFLNAVNNGNFTKLHMPIARFADGGSVLKEASDSTSRGVESFANNIGTNISNTNNISIGLVRDDDAIIANFLHSSKGQKYLLDFNRKNAKIINTF